MPRFLSLLCLALVATPVHAQTYTIVDLGTLGGPASQAHGMNAQGWVVGESVDENGQDHAFVYHDGHMTDLGLAGSLSAARSVNDAGQIGGYYYGKGYVAFRTTDQKVTDLGTLGSAYSMAYAINASGHTAGCSYTVDAREHAFLWDGHAMSDLGTLGGSYSQAFGVNATDLVVGYAYLANGMYHAFSGRTSGLTDLGTLGGAYSAANAVNDAGQIVGYACVQGNVKQHACLWLAGTAHDLGDLGGLYSDAIALDGSGTHIVGRASVPMQSGYLSYHAFLWSDGAMRDLNDLVPQGSGWVLEEAVGINDAGQIVGSGTHSGQHRAFLLQPSATPVAAQNPLPGSLALSGALPNPARNSARFSYALPRPGQVSIRVLDVSGRLVRDLVHESKPAGAYEVTWNLADDGSRRVGSGVYYARLQLGSDTRTTTVQVLR